MMYTLGTLIPLFIFANINTVLGARECYTCSTTTKPQCAFLNDTSGVDKCQTTTNDEINCLAYKYVLNGREIIYRGCRTKTDTCGDVKNALEKESKQYVACGLCDTDLCVTPASANPPVKVALLTLLVLITLRWIT